MGVCGLGLLVAFHDRGTFDANSASDCKEGFPHGFLSHTVNPGGKGESGIFNCFPQGCGLPMVSVPTSLSASGGVHIGGGHPQTGGVLRPCPVNPGIGNGFRPAFISLPVKVYDLEPPEVTLPFFAVAGGEFRFLRWIVCCLHFFSRLLPDHSGTP